MSIDKDALEVLLTIIELGSFRAAAEHLHKAQSSISYAIKTLEQDLGIEIFDRDSYRPQLTESGKLIYNKAKNILQMQEELQDLAKQIRLGIETQINLIVSIALPQEILIPVLDEFHKHYPQTQIKLTLSSFDQPVLKLTNKEADIAIGVDYNSIYEIHKIKLLSTKLIPVAKHSNIAVDPNLDTNSFNALTQIIVGERSLLADEITTGVLENSNIWYVMDFGLKLKLIHKQLGWGYMPENLIQEELQTQELLKIPRLETRVQNLYLMKRESSVLGPATQYLWDSFLNHRLEDENQALQ